MPIGCSALGALASNGRLAPAGAWPTKPGRSWRALHASTGPAMQPSRTCERARQRRCARRTARFRDVAAAAGGTVQPDVRLCQRRRLRRDGPALREFPRWCWTEKSTPMSPEIGLYEPLPNGRLSGSRARYFLVLAGRLACEAPERRSPGAQWVSSSTISRVPIVSGFPRSTHCMCGPGRTTRLARSRTGTPTCRATHSTPSDLRLPLLPGGATARAFSTGAGSRRSPRTTIRA